MEMSTSLEFEKIYFEVKEEFKEIIKDDPTLRKQLFNPGDLGISRKKLSSNYLKPLSHTRGAKPEAITVEFVRKLFNRIGISNEHIIPEIRLKIINVFKDKSINKYPDLAIINSSFKKDHNKSILFEIEALNKDLTKLNDREGIEQAFEWFKQSIGLFREYIAIITNFNEWYILKFDDKGDHVISSKKPYEILEIIRDIALGQERPYLGDEQGEAISKQFFEEFSKRLRIVIDPKNEKIKIIGSYGTPLLVDKKHDNNKIDFYRTNFHRLLFLKILLDWKLLKIDPVQEIILHEEKRNYYNTLRDLFFKVLNNDKKRLDVFDKFKDLPFLNGGLFRLTSLEEEYPNIALNSEAITDIWNLLKGYDFTLSTDVNIDKKSPNIDPNILGYIFEKSIGDFRKTSGAYYTKCEIANYISRNTLNKYLFDKVNKQFPKYQIQVLNQLFMYEEDIQIKISDFIISILKNVKICDPFVGSGAFLVSVGDLIVSIYKFIYENIRKWDLRYNEAREIEFDIRPFKDLYSMKTYIVQNNLYGIDINPSAIDICKLRLWLWITQPPGTLDFLNFFLNPLPNIEYNILEGNSFIGFTDDILKIDQIDKKTGEKMSFIPISEWGDKKEYSLSQMLKERNEKIQRYYDEKSSETRNQLKKEINELTLKFNEDIDNLLIYTFKSKSIVGKKIKLKSEDMYNQDLTNIYSMILRAKSDDTLEIHKKSKREILLDKNNHLVKGIIFRKKSILIQNRVFEPKRQDKFKPQKPLKIYEEILKYIEPDHIKEIEINFFLTKEDLEKIKRFHWSIEYSDFIKSRGFDILITNPPYGNILTPIEKRILTLEDKITEDIYINFLYKLSRNEIPFKYAGILCPKSYLLRQKYLDFRNYFLNNNSIYEITDIGSKQFYGATNEVQVLFFNSDKNYTDHFDIKEIHDNKTKISYSMVSDLDNFNYLDKIRICKNKICNYYDASSSFYYYTFHDHCPKCNEHTIPLNRIRIKPNKEMFQIIEKIEKNGNLNYLNPKDFPKMIRGEEDKGLKEVKKKIINDESRSCYFINAKADFRYYFFYKRKSLNLEEINAKLLKGNNYEYYISPKLLIKHNNIVPEAIFTKENVCFTSSIYSLLHDDNRELKFICAVLNSILIQFYCTYAINNQKDTTINLNQYMIRHLPFPKSQNNAKSKISELVDLIIESLEYNDATFNETVNKLLIKIDDMIFSLYSITTYEKQLIISNMKSRSKHFEKIYN